MACLLQSAWKKIKDINIRGIPERIRGGLENETIKGLFLIFFGAVASIILGGLLVDRLVINIRTCILMVLSIVLLLCGSGLVPIVWHHYNKRRRKSALKVGILNDMEWELENIKQISTNTDISPEDWEKEINELSGNEEVTVKLINAKNYFDKYNAIINPYGGVYPEYDLENLETMNKILSYIKDGGLFVNVADIPGFFACNPSIEPWRRVVTARKDAPYEYILQDNRAKPYAQMHLFHLTPFTRELGVDIYTVEYSSEQGFLESGKFKIHRVAVVGGFIDPKIELQLNTLPSLYPLGKKIPVTPLFFARYGDGKLLSSLIFEKEQDEELKMEIKKMGSSLFCMGKLIY